MMRSLYSGVTGLKNHQTRMDVIGNNIANINTVGFKSSRVIFQDIYSTTLQGATAPDEAAGTMINGGTNPQQIGLGMTLAAIDVLHTKGAPQYTGGPLDFSIDGDGYFVVHDDSQGERYTRAGNFYISENDYLVTADGSYIRGIMLVDRDDVNSDGYLVNNDGDFVDENGNLVGNPVKAPLGNIVISADYYDVTIDRTGKVIGLDENNEKVEIAQLQLATFNNANALEKAGGNCYLQTVNSGNPEYKTPGDGGSGVLNPGTLEMSNVDLAGEFTDMIVTQRGFQANSRIITTSDSMLEELVNLKR